MMINPMPKMRRQVGRPGVFLGFVDLNCSWYALRAIVAYHFERLTGRPMRHSRLPKPTLAAYSPSRDLPRSLRGVIQTARTPGTPAEWVLMLEQHGPLMVSGSVGPLGCAHSIVVVGIDDATLLVKDPIHGDEVRRRPLARLQNKLDDEVSYVPDFEGPRLVGQLGTL